jgi:pilus assembly protein CpaB
MKNIKAIGLLILAIITGLAAAVYAASWIAQRGSIASTKVVTAAVDIELGSKVNPQMLTSIDWPAGSVPEGAFTNIKDLEERVVKVGVQRGEAILERKLAPAGTKGGLSSVIADGKRAMTVRVNDVVGVAGFALPGNYVDVMLNTQQDRGSKDAGGPNQISLTVLEQVLVLAVAQEANRDDTKPKVVSAVTLELSPEDTEKLDLARSVGTLSLVLRNQLDKQTASTTGITRAQLLGMKHEAPKPAAVVMGAAPSPAPVVRRVAVRPTAPAPAPVVVKAQCVEVIRNGTAALSCF